MLILAETFSTYGRRVAMYRIVVWGMFREKFSGKDISQGGHFMQEFCREGNCSGECL